MNSRQLVIVDTGAANIHSVTKAVRVAGGDPVVTSSPEELLNARAAILPGVGANDSVMRSLEANELPAAIRDFAESGRPLLCVCIGMQVLMDDSEEGVLPGLGLIGGSVERLGKTVPDGLTVRPKIPHMGWNTLRFVHEGNARHPVFRGIPQDSHFYFVHSYHCVPDSPAVVAAEAHHGGTVCAAIVRDNIVGTQFHPEKSGRAGIDIYARFIDHAESEMQVAATKTKGPALSDRTRTPMKVIPAIDIRNGKCTRLVEGDYAREIQFDDDPAEAARRWAGMGAEMIHIVDLDGAKDGWLPNSQVVERVIAASQVPVQVGGGIRTLRDAERLLDAGASRIVFGTALVEDPETVAVAVSRFGADKVAVSIDAKGGEVRTRGWVAGTGIDAIGLAERAVTEIGIKTIIYTDTARDGTLTGPNFKSVSAVSLAVDCEVVAAGGVSSIDDLLKLQDIGVSGAITGMAIYTGEFDLAEAIEAVNSRAATP